MSDTPNEDVLAAEYQQMTRAVFDAYQTGALLPNAKDHTVEGMLSPPTILLAAVVDACMSEEAGTTRSVTIPSLNHPGKQIRIITQLIDVDAEPEQES